MKEEHYWIWITAWTFFEKVVKHFLGTQKTDNYKEHLTELLQNYKGFVIQLNICPVKTSNWLVISRTFLIWYTMISSCSRSWRINCVVNNFQAQEKRLMLSKYMFCRYLNRNGKVLSIIADNISKNEKNIFYEKYLFLFFIIPDAWIASLKIWFLDFHLDFSLSILELWVMNLKNARGTQECWLTIAKISRRAFRKLHQKIRRKQILAI